MISVIRKPFCKVVLYLNRPIIKCSRSDSESLNQHWLLSCVDHYSAGHSICRNCLTGLGVQMLIEDMNKITTSVLSYSASEVRVYCFTLRPSKDPLASAQWEGQSPSQVMLAGPVNSLYRKCLSPWLSFLPLLDVYSLKTTHLYQDQPALSPVHLWIISLPPCLFI